MNISTYTFGTLLRFNYIFMLKIFPFVAILFFLNGCSTKESSQSLRYNTKDEQVAPSNPPSTSLDSYAGKYDSEDIWYINDFIEAEGGILLDIPAGYTMHYEGVWDYHEAYFFHSFETNTTFEIYGFDSDAAYEDARIACSLLFVQETIIHDNGDVVTYHTCPSFGSNCESYEVNGRCVLARCEQNV